MNRRLFQVLLITAPLAAAAGCAPYKPAPASYAPQVARAQTATNGPIVASVGVLSIKEAEEKFGLSLHKKNIQPVWLRLTNIGTNLCYFLPAGLDAEYRPAAEVAYTYRSLLRGKRNRRIASVMHSNRMEIELPPGSVREGFVFSEFDPGAKHVRVDVLGESGYHRLEFTIPIPGKRIDYEKVNWEALYPTNEFRDLSLGAFRQELRRLPRETTSQDGRGRGDPLNLVVVADENDEFGLAFLRNNWDLTEVLTVGNVFKLMSSFLFSSRWRTSPVSPLYVFNRKQDIALQKARRTIHERNHLRLWLAPYTCERRSVMVGQISRDIGLRFSFRAPGLVTHKIDPETDEARDYLAQEMILGGSVRQVAWVDGVGAHGEEDPGRNLTGDPWFTDGCRVVLFLSREEIDPGEVHLLDWSSEERVAVPSQAPER